MITNNNFTDIYWKKYKKQGLVLYQATQLKIDEDGYFWIIGRVDDVIKVSGYRLGTAEIESIMITHPAVAESAAIGIPHPLKGNAIYIYIVPSMDLRKVKSLS